MRSCLPIAVGFFLAAVFCLLLSLCSCRPTEKLVEVERWRCDTVSVVDTVHITEVVVQHDSIHDKEYITEYRVDSTLTNVSYKYYTYNPDGGIASLLDYTSSIQHGSSSHTATESEKTDVSGQEYARDEKGFHSESQGHSEKIQSKEQEKKGLTKWQKFVMGMGYTFIVFLVLGAMFGAMRLYGKHKKL